MSTGLGRRGLKRRSTTNFECSPNKKTPKKENTGLNKVKVEILSPNIEQSNYESPAPLLSRRKIKPEFPGNKKPISKKNIHASDLKPKAEPLSPNVAVELKFSNVPLIPEKIDKVPSKKLKKKEVSIKDEKVKPKTKKIKEEGSTTSKGKKLVRNELLENKKKLLEEELLHRVSHLSNISFETAKNIVRLLDEEATIPFIVRYRKNMIQNMDADQLRIVKNNIELVRTIQSKRDFIIKKLESCQQLTPELLESLKLSNSIDELECLYAPFKSQKQNKIVEAKNLGLHPVAENILNGVSEVNMEEINNSINNALGTEELESLIVELVAQIMGNEPRIIKKIQQMKDYHRGISVTANMKKKCKSMNEKDVEVFQQYSQFSQEWKRVRPHQFLAISRGAAKGILNTSIVIPETVKLELSKLVNFLWINIGITYHLRSVILFKSFEMAYNKYMEPFLRKIIKNELKTNAEKASLESFASNLKWLLLSPPVRGVTVLAIDPGFYHGCKTAIVSPTGNVLHTDVLYLTSNNNAGSLGKLQDILRAHKVDIIAVGNGKGCREVEKILSRFLENASLKSVIQTTIVAEEGASIYSCSKEAKAEFPDVDPNLVSAITLARRVQDPMSELVKIEPKHLGVGMYQHDANEKKLESELSDVVMECVSNVGVDLNTASLKLLRFVSGLSEKKAQSVIDWRSGKGLFSNRSQLKLIKGIGDKTFQQCAGFVRILPETAVGVKASDLNPLDQTEIHPEFYHVAEAVLKDMGLDARGLGSEEFIKRAKEWLSSGKGSKPYGDITAENLKLIFDAFTTPLGRDLRLELSQPLFNREVTSVGDLEIGQTLTGRVANVTDFGAFVDIGVERHGLIPRSFLSAQVRLGNRVQVLVVRKDSNTNKVTLSLTKVI